MTCIFLLVLGGGQDKPAWTACPPGVKITRVGDGRYPGTPDNELLFDLIL